MRERTLLSRDTLNENRNYVDWETQPSAFKFYPSFLSRIDLKTIPQLEWLRHTRFPTQRLLMGKTPYYRLNVPSAGNLHPLEIYVQLRNIAGVLSGVYHLDTLKGELVMIREIGREGIEPLVGLQSRYDGVILMISIVPFRSYWKYGLRSWRYLYLDLGHQIAALSGSVRHFGHELSKMSVSSELNRTMGMGEDERIVAVYGIGSSGTRPVRKLESSLMKVSPCDYTLNYDDLLGALNQFECYTSLPPMIGCENFTVFNQSRRSAREFESKGYRDNQLNRVMQIPYPESITPLFVLWYSEKLEHGVYRNGKSIQRGEYREEITKLLLNQQFVSHGDMAVLICADSFDQRSHIEAGIYAHGLYLICEEMGLACTGIGAFFDEESKDFIDKPLLYGLVIGGKRTRKEHE